jgi:hypothetical protein
MLNLVKQEEQFKLARVGHVLLRRCSSLFATYRYIQYHHPESSDTGRRYRTPGFGVLGHWEHLPTQI